MAAQGSLIDVLKGIMQTNSSGSGQVDNLFTRKYPLCVGDTGIATNGTAMDFTVCAEIVSAGEVTGAKVGFTGDVTANATNYATLIVAKNDGAGGSETTVASRAFDTVTTDDATTEAWWELTLAGSGASSVAAGDAIGVEVTKTGTGLAIPEFTAVVTVEERF